jgi:hypothetical protein
MKRTLATSLILLVTTVVYAQQDKDIANIKSFCGCFDVDFKYAETFKSDSNYKLAKPYLAKATEWVEIIEEEKNKIVLQHLLVISDSMIIKHWREDWTYENTSVLNYDQSFTWKKVSLDPQSVKGQWTQSVWEVSDEPRYQGSATWIHADGKNYWQNTTDAPLPRREYTQRYDYNVLNRTNTLWITNTGWIHEQDNKKIIRKAGLPDSLLVMEKGYNIYYKITDSKCASAKKWWADNKNRYEKVRKDWDDKIAGSTEIKL